MTSASGEPIPSITDATLNDIATNGIWSGAGLDINPAALNVARALLAALQAPGEGGELPAELARLVAGVREVSTFSLPRIISDGTRLSAFTIKLNTSEPRPLVVMPAGWNPYGWLPFMYSYLTLASRGYHVLAYTPRGIGIPGWVSTSDGYIEVAGPHDWADGSTVLDYAQEYFAPSRIGFLGESYGSGISQLVAAHDPANRVSAVVALSTWGNLATSLYDNGTRHIMAVKALIGFTGAPEGKEETKFAPETWQILKDFEKGANLDEVVAWGTERSPEAYVDVTNARGIPTFVSNTWHESLFPAGSVLDTFDRLAVPKHLNMWIGDHGAPEGPGLAGLVGGLPFPGLKVPMQEAYDWLDHFLRGVDNEVPSWPQVNNQVMFTYQTKPVPGLGNRITVPAHREPSAELSDVTTSIETWYLNGNGGNGDGMLQDKQAAGWSRSFTAGHETAATAMDDIIKTGQKEWFGNPKPYDLAAFERPRLLVWATEQLTGTGGVARRIRGTATVRVTVRNTERDATLVAYLFDVAPDGTARIITHEPCTVTDLDPNEDRTVIWRLQPAAYDLPDGHRLALVVNSRDKLYAFTGKVDSTTAISSLSGDEAALELPLG
ncbi:CocE/NonD family hydrolase [Kitasatospora sp. NPDC004669]|uniref:CocE/NonD family hydrolase n=1 Tax=Kitasatospora sp. NPDC004669 TaxID=3154555 RepID=UPI0033B857B8